MNIELLNDWLNQISWEKLVNRNGLTWRGLPDETKAQVNENAAATSLMLEKPSVIKRPVLVQDQKIIQLGFDEAAYEKSFPK